MALLALWSLNKVVVNETCRCTLAVSGIGTGTGTGTRTMGTGTGTRTMGTIGVGPSPCSGVLHKTIQPILPGPGPGPGPEHNKCN